MAAKTYMTDFEALRRIFELAAEKNDSTRWNLYRGMNDNFASRGTVLYKQTSDEMDKDESWSLLRQLIEDNSSGGGDFSIYWPPKGGHKTGGTDSMSAYFRVEGPVSASGSRLAGLPMAMSISKAEMQEAIEKERRLWELERKLEDMENERANQTSWGQAALGAIIEDGTLSRVIETLAPNIAGALVGLLGKIFPGAVAQPATVAVSGFPSISDAEAAETEHYDAERVAGFLNAIRPHFNSHEEMYQFLDKVAAFFVKNPGMSKTFFQ